MTIILVVRHTCPQPRTILWQLTLRHVLVIRFVSPLKERRYSSKEGPPMWEGCILRTLHLYVPNLITFCLLLIRDPTSKSIIPYSVHLSILRPKLTLLSTIVAQAKKFLRSPQRWRSRQERHLRWAPLLHSSAPLVLLHLLLLHSPNERRLFTIKIIDQLFATIRSHDLFLFKVGLLPSSWLWFFDLNHAMRNFHLSFKLYCFVVIGSPFPPDCSDIVHSYAFPRSIKFFRFVSWSLFSLRSYDYCILYLCCELRRRVLNILLAAYNTCALLFLGRPSAEITRSRCQSFMVWHWQAARAAHDCASAPHPLKNFHQWRSVCCLLLQRIHHATQNLGLARAPAEYKLSKGDPSKRLFCLPSTLRLLCLQECRALWLMTQWR